MTRFPHKVLTSVLRLTKQEGVEVQRISEDAQMAVHLVKSLVMDLTEQDLLEFEEGRVTASLEQRVRLASEALKLGADPETICKVLSWREFENMATLFLRKNGYRAVQNLHFKNARKKFEIDVLGLRQPLVLAVDCKHWKRSWQRTATKRMVEAQLERSKRLGSSLAELRGKLGISSWTRAEILPTVLTLSDTPLKIHHGVPVVSVLRFQNFLLELHSQLDALNVLKVEMPRITDFNQG